MTRITHLLRAHWPVLVTLVVGAVVVAGVGFAAGTTSGAMWAGGFVGVLIGIVIGWQNHRREAAKSSRSGPRR